MARPIVIVHGYSDEGKTALDWHKLLCDKGYDATNIHVSQYVSLSNEVTIKDIAEGFDRSLRIRAGLKDNEEFDAIVHSTGMLVVRAWLTTYASRAARLKHLIGLAPATFGSPMAHKGRSVLGGIFKGNRKFGPDFMEAGDRVLSGLELGSVFTWDLAHRDFLADGPAYGEHETMPYPFIFIGLKDYGLLKRLATEPGTDGTVRWSGAGFTSRKITVDLTREPDDIRDDRPNRVVFEPWRNARVPLVLLADHNHGTIFGSPTGDLVQSVVDALAVSDAPSYAEWNERHRAVTAASLQRSKADLWQQFVTRLVDERGDGITDYYVELYTRGPNGELIELEDFNLDYHAFREDPSYRCFHVNLTETGVQKLDSLFLRLIASSGSKLVGYHGFGSERMTETGAPKLDSDGTLAEGKWDAVIDLSSNLTQAMDGEDPVFFMPFTTTLVEMKMNREPMPLDGNQPNLIAWFIDSFDAA